MSIIIAGVTFDRVRYDPEGRLVGLTIVNARWVLDQGGPVTATTPQRVEIDAAALGPVIDSAA